MKGWKGRLGKQNGERLVDGWVDQRTIDGRTDGLMNEWTDRRTDGPADEWTDRRTKDGLADDGRTKDGLTADERM